MWSAVLSAPAFAPGSGAGAVEARKHFTEVLGGQIAGSSFFPAVSADLSKACDFGDLRSPFAEGKADEQIL